MTVAPGARFGPYEIVSALGAGGMGEVYRARDTRLDRTVAIKILPDAISQEPAVRERFVREARAISALDDHPNICALHDIGEHEGRTFLVMQYVEGETLAERLARGPLPLAEALRIATDIAGALDYAHRRGIVHRDLKPANVMLARGGSGSAGSPQAKLLDFGLAKTLAPARGPGTVATTAADLTAEGTILGTLHYMPPEQLDGRDTDARSDIFSFGATLYEMVTGRKAFEGRGQASIIGAIMRADPPPISSVQPLSPPALDRVVQTCLAKDPDDRWQTARDMLRELRWAVEPVPASAPSRRRFASIALWGGAAVVAAAAVVLVLVGRRAREDAPPSWANGAIKLSLAFPAGTRPPVDQGNISPAAVAPDGRSIAFVGRGADAIQRIWVQSLDGTPARELPGTDGASFPFWSPDGRALGFFAEGKLARVNVAGGSVQILAGTSPVSPGAAWSTENVIVFTTRFGLYQIPAGGGSPSLVAALDRSRQENSLRFPHFLPDGRRFLYVARSGRPENNAAYVGSLDGKPVRLFATMSQVLYSPPGYLLFLRGRTLIARPFDARTLTVGSDSIDVADGVGGNSVSVLGTFSVSPSGVLVYTPPIDRPSTLRWFDRSGRALGDAAGPDEFEQFRAAPDGRRVVAAIADLAAGTRSLWMLDGERPATRLTFAGSHDWEPIWSPDGSRVAFASYRDGPLNLYVRALSGVGGDRPLLISDEQKDLGDWSADGRFVVYRQVRPDNAKGDIWVVPLEPGSASSAVSAAEGGRAKPTPIATTDAEERAPRFSPDGRWIAYESDESGRMEVYVQPFPPSGGKWQVSSGGGTEPTWAGHELFYVASPNVLTAVEVHSGETFQSGKPTRLFEIPVLRNVAVNQYDVTRDGQRFLVRVLPAQSSPPPMVVVLNWQARLGGSR